MPNTKTLLERSPFYVFLGAADAALETVRSSFDTATEAAENFRDDFTPEQVQERILNAVGDVREQVAALPGLATEQYATVAGNVQRAYEEFVANYIELAARGVELTQQVTTQGLSAVATAREAAREAGDSTFAAVTSGVPAKYWRGSEAAEPNFVGWILDARKEAAKGVERLAGLAGRGADVVEAEAETVKRSTAAKQGAAKRPSRKSVAKKASARKAAAKPAAKKAPVAKKTVATKPAVKKPAVKKAVVKKARATKATAKPVVANPVATKPVATKPVANKPETPAKPVAPKPETAATLTAVPTLPVEAKNDNA